MAEYMKKIVTITVVLMVAAASVLFLAYAAENWRNYESNRNNIQLDGYLSQPGYIAFTDGDGNVIGYLYACTDGFPNGRLYWAGAGIANTTQIGSQSTGGGTVSFD